MFIFDHLFDVFILLVLALLIFGPTKMIAMGSDLGRMVRQFREATRGMSWTDLLSGNFEEANQAHQKTPPFGQAAPPSVPLAHTPPTGTDVDAQVVDATLATEEEPRLR